MPTSFEALKPGTIRFLRLHAGGYDEPLSCAFHVASIDNPALLPYEAISYLWGDATDLRPVKTPLGTLHVTANSDLALRRFRLQQCDRILWMDQLCIDQGNPSERSEQVSLMWKIYSRATTVLMWLGSDSEGLAAAGKEFVEELQSRCETPAKLRGELDEGLRQEGLPPPDSVKWVAYKRLMALPYFTRVWMLQEVLLASAAKAFCGEVEISWYHIARAAIWGAESFDLQGLHSVEDHGFVIEQDCTMVRQMLDGNDHSDLGGSSLSWMIGLLGTVKPAIPATRSLRSSISYRKRNDLESRLIIHLLNLTYSDKRLCISFDWNGP